MKLPSAIVAATILCLSPQGAYATDVNLSGTAFYRERIALPEDAALLVKFVDLAKPETTLREVTVAPAGQVPIAFVLAIDSGDLSKERAYAIQARIEVSGSTWFANSKPIPVDLENTAVPVSIFLVRAGAKDAQAPTGVSLAGTQWRVLELDGKDTDPNVMSTLIFGADGAVNGNGGCNSFRGDVDIDGARMKFGHMASTMMACDGAKSAQEALFHKALSQTSSYAVRNGELTLVDAAGMIVARLGEP